MPNLKISKIANIIKTNNYNSKVKIKFNIANNTIDSLDDYRKKIRNKKIMPDEAIEFYSRINSKLIQIIKILLQQNNDKEIIQISQSILFFLKIKENAGIERAVLSNILSVDSFDINYFRKFSTSVSNQNNLEELFLQYANKEQIKEYDKLIRNNNFKNLKKYTIFSSYCKNL